MHRAAVPVCYQNSGQKNVLIRGDGESKDGFIVYKFISGRVVFIILGYKEYLVRLGFICHHKRRPVGVDLIAVEECRPLFYALGQVGAEVHGHLHIVKAVRDRIAIIGKALFVRGKVGVSGALYQIEELYFVGIGAHHALVHAHHIAVHVGHCAAGFQVALFNHIEEALYRVLGVIGGAGEVFYLLPVVLFADKVHLALTGLQAGIPVLQGFPLQFGGKKHRLYRLCAVSRLQALTLRYIKLGLALLRGNGKLELYLSEEDIQVHLGVFGKAQGKFRSAHGANSGRGADLEFFLPHKMRNANFYLPEKQHKARRKRFALLYFKAGSFFKPDLGLIGHQQHCPAVAGGAHGPALGYLHIFSGGDPLTIAAWADFHGAAHRENSGLTGQNRPRQRYQK